MAIKGLHVAPNFTEAREHFEAAAARDLPSALNGLGAWRVLPPFCFLLPACLQSWWLGLVHE